ncbi:ATP synthase-coupling factor 6, mitochondrial [Daphnia magna]|uniref:Uncharacterized protein n=2 Tax=Daphnia magna TaxID=35525 RepID=A0ABQ9YND0_9CRUS|nr:ATP synthase-coupling factor 6, mitochondrial [Daphnia magna]KAK4002124.1 hypothetical protein OUZ56_003972 [Daphnia magna]KZS18481.1 ATP synthase-coupling factor [Daphnia magna]
MLATRTRLAVRQGTILQRQFGLSAVAANKAMDPIQKLFLDKLNEYKVKSKAAGGKMVDPSPTIQKEITTELDRVRRVFGGADGTDMTKFPTFNFPEPKVDPINS